MYRYLPVCKAEQAQSFTAVEALEISGSLSSAGAVSFNNNLLCKRGIIVVSSVLFYFKIVLFVDGLVVKWCSMVKYQNILPSMVAL